MPIGRTAGLLWLLAGLGFAASAALLVLGPGRWWVAALPALLLSQTLVVLAWPDARFGTIANALVLVPLALALLEQRPGSFRSIYDRESRSGLAAITAPAPLVTERDLAPLPPPVQAFLRRAGVVGRPRVRAFRARFHGRIRNGLDAPWMPFTSEQTNLVSPSARLFLLEASRLGLPFEGLHAFTGDHARMQIRVAGLLDVADGRGEEMDRGETVTILNDLCVLAPAALVDAPVRWTALDARTARATLTRGARTVSAVLTFDAQGDLVDFVSEDRFMSADGKTYERLPWRTPLRDHRSFGGVRLPAYAEAVWRTAKGDFLYGEFHLDEIAWL